MKKTLILSGILAVITAMPCRAWWIGNPARYIEKDKTSVQFLYDTGEKKVIESDNAAKVDLNSHRFYIQLQRGHNYGFQTFARFLPSTGRLNFKNSDFNPHLFGTGVGLQWSPQEPIGPVSVGILGAVDYAFGSTKRKDGQSGHDSVSWAEGSVAAGASVAVFENLKVYGGLSLIRSDIKLDVSGTETNWENDKEYGPYLGLDFLANEAWSLSAEVHTMNETTWNLSARYSFQ
ncbi:MAG TPA: hypothetical protein PK876_07595 [Elusimicrobiota bacterium]|nr:hypothetical protein [Elusimicrobiota bacterium]